jgi:hypothetical protein
MNLCEAEVAKNPIKEKMFIPTRSMKALKAANLKRVQKMLSRTNSKGLNVFMEHAMNELEPENEKSKAKDNTIIHCRTL